MMAQIESGSGIDRASVLIFDFASSRNGDGSVARLLLAALRELPISLSLATASAAATAGDPTSVVLGLCDETLSADQAGQIERQPAACKIGVWVGAAAPKESSTAHFPWDEMWVATPEALSALLPVALTPVLLMPFPQHQNPAAKQKSRQGRSKSNTDFPVPTPTDSLKSPALAPLIDAIGKRLQQTASRRPSSLAVSAAVANGHLNPGSASVNMSDLQYRQMTAGLRELVQNVVPAGASVAVVSKGDHAMLEIPGRVGRHFPATADGRWIGYHPADDATAILHLEAARADGVDCLVLPRSAMWWLHHYPAFRAHLSIYPILGQSSDGIIFQLRSAGPPPVEITASRVDLLLKTVLPLLESGRQTQSNCDRLERSESALNEHVTEAHSILEHYAEVHADLSHRLSETAVQLEQANARIDAVEQAAAEVPAMLEQQQSAADENLQKLRDELQESADHRMESALAEISEKMGITAETSAASLQDQIEALKSEMQSRADEMADRLEAGFTAQLQQMQLEHQAQLDSQRLHFESLLDRHAEAADATRAETRTARDLELLAELLPRLQQWEQVVQSQGEAIAGLAANATELPLLVNELMQFREIAEQAFSELRLELAAHQQATQERIDAVRSHVDELISDRERLNELNAYVDARVDAVPAETLAKTQELIESLAEQIETRFEELRSAAPQESDLAATVAGLGDQLRESDARRSELTLLVDRWVRAQRTEIELQQQAIEDMSLNHSASTESLTELLARLEAVESIAAQAPGGLDGLRRVLAAHELKFEKLARSIDARLEHLLDSSARFGSRIDGNEGRINQMTQSTQAWLNEITAVTGSTVEHLNRQSARIDAVMSLLGVTDRPAPTAGARPVGNGAVPMVSSPGKPERL